MFQPTGFSLDTFNSRYTFIDKETWINGCLRLARQAIICESPEKQNIYLDKFNEILSENYFMPGGRIWYGSGRYHPNLLNCFVMRSDLDSKEGWGNIARDIIITSMMGGGCGTDFSDVRPNGADINSQRGSCPGPVSLMKLVNGLAEPIRAGGARRTALLFALSLEHPDILEFLNCKLKNNDLTYANISVISDKTKQFIKAVNSNKNWQLSWKNKYKKDISAQDIWNIIVNNAYQNGEPGFLNRELAEQESPISYIQKLRAVNPCGELWLVENESCCLGSLVLPRFIKNNEIDWNLLKNTIKLSVRYLDNIISINYYPLMEQKEIANKLRRIGVGVTGLADMLILLGYKYGSVEANKFIDKLFKFISVTTYEASIMLAVEKGPFPLCQPENHINTGFVSRMPKRIKNLILEHGIRNCALLTCPPTGTISIVSGNCSSGIEPIFAPAYRRNFFDKDERKSETIFHPLFKQFYEEGKDLSNFISARELTVEQHLEVQKIVQKHVDGAISKTVNIPEDYPIQDLSKTWLKYLPYIKGATFYRENSRGFVDKEGKIQEPPLVALNIEDAKKLFTKGSKEGSIEHKCKSGVCEL